MAVFRPQIQSPWGTDAGQPEQRLHTRLPTVPRLRTSGESANMTEATDFFLQQRGSRRECSERIFFFFPPNLEKRITFLVKKDDFSYIAVFYLNMALLK